LTEERYCEDCDLGRCIIGAEKILKEVKNLNDFKIVVGCRKRVSDEIIKCIDCEYDQECVIPKKLICSKFNMGCKRGKKKAESMVKCIDCEYRVSCRFSKQGHGCNNGVKSKLTRAEAIKQLDHLINHVINQKYTTTDGKKYNIYKDEFVEMIEFVRNELENE